MSHISNRIGPFMYSSYTKLMKRTVAGVEFIIGIASAYNAFGLIGSEKNGVFVLDDTNKNVILDEGAKASSGYYGPSNAQRQLQLDLAVGYTDTEFLDYCRGSQQYRGYPLPEIERV